MGRGQADKDPFSSVLGNKRGISVEDTLLAERPTDRARAEFKDLLTSTRAGGWEMSEEDFRRLSATIQEHRALVHERPLLHALAFHLTHQAAADMMSEKLDFHLALLGALMISDEGRRADFTDAFASRHYCVLEDALKSIRPFEEALRAGIEELHEAILPEACAWAIRVEGLKDVLGAMAGTDWSSPLSVSFDAVAGSFKSSADYLVASRAIISALGGEMPTDAKIIRGLIAAPLLQASEAHYLARVAERRTEDAKRSKEQNDLFQAECARAGEIMEAMPQDAAPDDVLMALSSGLAASRPTPLE